MCRCEDEKQTKKEILLFEVKNTIAALEETKKYYEIACKYFMNMNKANLEEFKTDKEVRQKVNKMLGLFEEIRETE